MDATNGQAPVDEGYSETLTPTSGSSASSTTPATLPSSLTPDAALTAMDTFNRRRNKQLQLELWRAGRRATDGRADPQQSNQVVVAVDVL